MRLLLMLALLSWLCIYSLYTSHDIVTIKKPVFRSIKFVDDWHGWLAGYKGVFYTLDGGKTWQKQSVNIGDFTLPTTTTAMRDVGWIAWADKGSAIIRSDTGISIGQANSEQWRNVRIPAEILRHLGSISFANQRFGWGIGFGVILRTADGGVTWRIFDEPISTSLKSLHAFSPTDVWMAGGEATIIHFKDNTRNVVYRRLNTDITGDLLCVYFINPKTGWVCGTDGLIYNTVDGGDRWERQYTPFSKSTAFHSISFINPKEGWVTGARYTGAKKDGSEVYEGVALYTTDGGDSWHSSSSNTKEALVSVQALSNGRAWVAGIDGTLLFTTDRGKSWQSRTIK